MLTFQRSSLPFSTLLQSSDYSALIQQAIFSHLVNSSPVTHWVAIEARLEGELIGLSISEIYPLHQLAQIDSLVVIPSHRRQGIGRQLFAFTENLLIQEENIRVIEVMYEQADLFTPALEKILSSLGWSPATLLLIRCHFDVKAFNPHWFQRSYPLPASMSFFPWKELQLEERGYIEYLAEQGRFLETLSPFLEEKLIDRETSVGLRQKEKIVGWSITRRLNPSTIYYSSLYIDSDLLYKGYGIQLLIESIRRQKQLPIPYAIFEVSVKEIDPSWWRFIKKRLMPHASKIDRIKKAIKIKI